MTRDEVFRDLTPVFEDVFDEQVVLGEGTTAEDVDEWDSVNHIRLVLAIEKAFKVKFATAEIDRLECVGDLVTLILSKKDGAGA